MKKIKAWLQLLSVNGIGNTKAIKLAQLWGEPHTFIHTNKLQDVDFITENAKRELFQNNEVENWTNIVKLIANFQIKFVSILDENYPESLKNIFDPPPFLFYRGTLKKEDFRRSLAIVGTRKASNYGKLMTKKIGSKLAQAGFTLVSGLAYGIDTLAHFSALENSGRTIAVMGTGVDQIYPPRNRELAEMIIQNGALISEFVPGSKAERWNFPIRNRIISGISIGSFIVEGSKKSGALLTAKYALDQNRDIFALPGDVNRETSTGPNYLIKLGAKIVCSVNDILEEYDFIVEQTEKPVPKLSETEEIIYQILLQNKPEMLFDNLILKSKMTVSQLSTILLSLELKGIIKKVPGNKIVPLI
ncbi:MAG: DNA-protecting protein DprA [Candidatus Cloacimonetes bacterium]|jgi:DNA processing protein|nr:DNA-protecting protein DprA [Candidatus Cloacimonadota bacterium]MBT6994463.1 DNA-protecting protein DprA [Candidatus Cloacimonadota bacterium]MBT7470246.1 DNA-protecting protein DprA [Candidatus Cloacimonadota bacterium]